MHKTAPVSILLSLMLIIARCHPVPRARSHGNSSDPSPLHDEVKKEKGVMRDEFHQEETKDKLEGMTIKIESSDQEEKASTKYSLHEEFFNDVVGEIFKDFQAELSVSTEKMMDILFNKATTENKKTQRLSLTEPSTRNRSTEMTTVRVQAKNDNTGNRVIKTTEPGTNTTEDWGLNNHNTPTEGSTFSNASTNKDIRPLLSSIMVSVEIKDPGMQKVSGPLTVTTKTNTEMSLLLKARLNTSDDRNFTTSNVTQTVLTISGLAMNNTLKNQTAGKFPMDAVKSRLSNDSTAINRAESIGGLIRGNALKRNLSSETHQSALGNYTSLLLNDTKQGVQFEITKKTVSVNQLLENRPNNTEELLIQQLGKIRGRELLRRKANVSCTKKGDEKSSRKGDQTAFRTELAELVIELKAIVASITVRETAKAPVNNGNNDRMTQFLNNKTIETNGNEGSWSGMVGKSTPKNKGKKNIHEGQYMNETGKVEESGDTIGDKHIEKMSQNINNGKENKETSQSKANLIANETNTDKQIMTDNEEKMEKQGNDMMKGKGLRKEERDEKIKVSEEQRQVTDSPARLLVRLLSMVDRSIMKTTVLPPKTREEIDEIGFDEVMRQLQRQKSRSVALNTPDEPLAMKGASDEVNTGTAAKNSPMN